MGFPSLQHVADHTKPVNFPLTHIKPIQLLIKKVILKNCLCGAEGAAQTASLIPGVLQP